jgi:hypothetical protein
VFLLAPEPSARVTAEYRKRAPWANLDAAQAESLVYAVRDDTVVLEKAGNDWAARGKPGTPVNAAAVNDVLATLAGLRVERYVTDAGADLPLYGLQPPERTVIVHPRGGTPVALHLGRFEGDSKRVYARVPDSNRSDVVVLSEADSAKLVRELGVFLGK